MVTRKPVPPNSQPDSSTLPYPSTPTSAGFDRHSPRGQSSAAEDAGDAQDAWSSSEVDSTSQDNLPASLRPGDGKHAHLNTMDLPDSLRIRTPTPDHTPRSSAEMDRPTAESTNPYLRGQHTGQNITTDTKDSSASAWGGFAERPEQPSNAPPPPPIAKGKILCLCCSVSQIPLLLW
jgi:hypothetical protein